jgi:hypothetical protein
MALLKFLPYYFVSSIKKMSLLVWERAFIRRSEGEKAAEVKASAAGQLSRQKK